MFWIAVFAVTVIFVLTPFALEALRRPVRELRNSTARQGQLANLPSGKTWYDWHGHLNGPVAVCVHGLSTPSFVWGALVSILTKMGFRILTYDLYGRGLSDRVAGKQNEEFHLRQLDELLADQGVKDGFTLIGYSMGGAIATAFAARSPSRLIRLILLAPAGLKHDLGIVMKFVARFPLAGDWLMLTLGARNLRKGIRAEAAGFQPAVDGVYEMQEAELDVKGYMPAITSSMRFFLVGDQSAGHKKIADAGLPVLAVWGENDDVIPQSCLGRLAEINRNARQVSIPGAPHGLTYTHPEELRTALQELMHDGL